MSQENMTNSDDGVNPNLDAKRREEEGTPSAPPANGRGFSMTELLMKKFSGALGTLGLSQPRQFASRMFGGLMKGTSKAGSLFRITPEPQPQSYRFNYKVHARGGYYKKR